MLLAVLVHVVTVLVLGLGVALALIGWPAPVLVIFGAIIVAIGASVLPRPQRLRSEVPTVTRDSAPVLFGLLDEVAAEIGGRPPDLVAVDMTANASWGALGWRRRRVLTIGAPLWAVLQPQEQLALLGHELGHEVNGDTRNGLVVWGALDTLRHWRFLLRPNESLQRQAGRGIRRSFGGIAVLAEMLANLLMLPVSLSIGAASAGLHRLFTTSGPRAEYRADQLSATVSSPDAARSLLEKIIVVPPAVRAVGHARLRGDQRSPWDIERQFLAALPEHERDRLVRLAAREHQSVDDEHPPTARRIRLLSTRVPSDGAGHEIAFDHRAVDAELSAALARVSRIAH